MRVPLQAEVDAVPQGIQTKTSSFCSYIPILFSTGPGLFSASSTSAIVALVIPAGTNRDNLGMAAGSPCARKEGWDTAPSQV